MLSFSTARFLVVVSCLLCALHEVQSSPETTTDKLEAETCTTSDNNDKDNCNANLKDNNINDNATQEDDDNEKVWCHDCDLDDILDELECNDNLQGLPVPTLSDYMTMRRAYHDIMGEEYSSFQSGAVEQDSFLVPHQAKVADGDKGRGIFATEFIPQGTPVFSHSQTATFYDGRSVRQFLRRIPRALACDVLVWAYVEWEDREANIASFSVELDDSALCNNGRQPYEEANLGCHPQDETDCDDYAYATRDIQAGEELLCQYAQFSQGVDAWRALGLGYSGSPIDP